MNLEEALRENKRLRSELAARDATIAILIAKIESLENKVAKLEAKKKTNSSNSSKPPSSDPPGNRYPKPKEKSKRKQGAQKGHKSQIRKLLPESEVTNFVACRPNSECTCGGHITINEENYERRQQIEIPPIIPEITEYQIFKGNCSRCGEASRGVLPAGTSSGILGPRVLAMCAILTGLYHLSKRQVKEILSGFFGVSISLGSVCGAERRVSEALQVPCQEVKSQIAVEPTVHMDETGHKVLGQRAWMWIMSTVYLAIYSIRPRRNQATAKELLTESFSGVLVSDRAGAYSWLPIRQRQFCWAHLIREFKKFSEYGGIAGNIGDLLLDYVKQMFHLWHEYQNKIISWGQFQFLSKSIRTGIEKILADGIKKPLVHALCLNLLKRKEALWTFMRILGVEPTNNNAEQGLRTGVIWRKTSFQTQGENGNRFNERILTVVSTCKRQRKNVLDYVTLAIRNHLMGAPAPSLLPTKSS